MFEMILIAALSQTAILPRDGFTTSVATGPAWHLDPGVARAPALIEPTRISWRGSVEAASAGHFDEAGGFSSAHSASEPLQIASIPDSTDVSYDAMLAKRWHWFELYGASRLHVIPKESRMPWWFSY